MKKFGIYLLTIIAFSTLASTFALEMQTENQEQLTTDDNNFLQTSLEETKSNTESQTETETEEEGYGCGRPNYGYDSCGVRPGYGYGSGYGSGSCGTGFGLKRKGIGSGYGYGSGYGLGRGRTGYCGYGKGGYKGIGYGGKYFGHGAGVGAGACATDGFYNRGYGHGYGRGYAGHGYGDNFYNGFYGNDDIFCGSGPSYNAGYASGRGHYNGRKDLRGKYLSLEDAAALLGCERERKIAAAKAYKGKNKASCANSGSKYLDKDCKIHKKICGENSCDDCTVDSGKDFRKRKCSSADKANCNRDHHFNIKKSHSKLNCRNGKKEALCMNTNNLDKNCCDGDLLEEFDKLEHFKKCSKGHKENLKGNDCTVKKSHHVHNCKDTHSLACHKNKKNSGSKNRASADSRESCDYHEHDRRNKNARHNKIAKECKAEKDLTKAAKYDSERDGEIKRQNSKGIACAKKDRLLKKAKAKDIKGGCIDKKKCINAGIKGEVCKEEIESPVC